MKETLRCKWWNSTGKKDTKLTALSLRALEKMFDRCEPSPHSPISVSKAVYDWAGGSRK